MALWKLRMMIEEEKEFVVQADNVEDIRQEKAFVVDFIKGEQLNRRIISVEPYEMISEHPK